MTKFQKLFGGGGYANYQVRNMSSFCLFFDVKPIGLFKIEKK